MRCRGPSNQGRPSGRPLIPVRPASGLALSKWQYESRDFGGGRRCAERSPTAVGGRDASDLDHLAASLEALALCRGEPDVEEAGYGHGHGEAQVGEVVAMASHSFMGPGVFEPEVVAAMSEAFEAACEVLENARQPEVIREIIAKRIVSAATIGERDPVRLLAAALAERQIG